MAVRRVDHERFDARASGARPALANARRRNAVRVFDSGEAGTHSRADLEADPIEGPRARGRPAQSDGATGPEEDRAHVASADRERWAGGLTALRLAVIRSRAPLLLVLLLAVFAARLLHTAQEKSFTVDEPHYVGTALYLWETGDYHYWRSTRLHPPLTFHLSGLPLLAMDLGDVPSSPDLGLHLLERDGSFLERLRLWTRIPFILLTCWGAILAFCWAREAAGDGAALLAAFLFSFSPTLLANGGVVHSDITVTVFFLQTLYALFRFCGKPTVGRMVLVGVSLGLALISKHSALILLPVLAVLLGALALGWLPAGGEAPRAGASGRLARSGWAVGVFLTISILAIGVLWVGYGGSFALVENGGRRLPAYVQSMLFFEAANDLGRTAFLFGEYSRDGWWYFFPVAFSIKTPLGVIALIALAAIAPWRRVGLAEVVLLVPMLSFAFVACFLWKVPMGVRYILPVIPLLLIWVAIRLAKQLDSWRRWPIAAGCLWLTVASLWIHPHYLAYFNELVGGPRQGYRYLVGSDLDWGQDLGTLARYIETNDISPPLWLAYFGLERPRHYGLRARPLVGCEPVSGRVAISASLLQRMYSPPGSNVPAPEGCYDWLLAREPVASIGYSILLYDVTTP